MTENEEEEANVRLLFFDGGQLHYRFFSFHASKVKQFLLFDFF